MFEYDPTDVDLLDADAEMAEYIDDSDDWVESMMAGLSDADLG